MELVLCTVVNVLTRGAAAAVVVAVVHGITYDDT